MAQSDAGALWAWPAASTSRAILDARGSPSRIPTTYILTAFVVNVLLLVEFYTMRASRANPQQPTHRDSLLPPAGARPVKD